jgi:SAM-dependent methyltransferase
VAEVDPDLHSRMLAAESLADGDPTGWFERLYAAAEGGQAVVPWDRQVPSPLLVRWFDEQPADGAGRSAIVVGCGFGRDAEYVAGRGYDTLAFDISASAINGARRRHPGSQVRYEIGDLLNPPGHWLEAFDLVVESGNVQALPDPPRRRAIRNVGHLVRRGGTLIVVAFARDDGGPTQGPPWPLSRAEVDSFAVSGLRAVRVEEIGDGQQPPVRRWRAEFRRPDAPR